MSSIIQTEAAYLKELKFIQLKNYQISQKNPDGSGTCIAIDHRNQITFVCCQNELIFVPLVSLLNFDVWSKSFLNNIDQNVSGKTVIKISQQNEFISHSISISSKGYGSKLVLACHGSNQSFIFFYHIDSIYDSKEQSTSYNHFNFPITGSSPTKVRFLSWHPEMNDNVFACSMTDGSFYILYVGDFPHKIIIILFHLSSDRNISAFSWSPKGKQIVISFRNSYFAQYKLQLNEQNLVQSSTFQEIKRIELPENFRNFQITNIFWLSTFNFVIICRCREFTETCFLLVSIPSPKATDAIIKIIDFGRLILESIDSPDLFEGYIVPLENLIFFYTNKSSDFALIGCNSNELNFCENWAEITNDDDYRLMFSDSDSVMIRGLNFINGTSKQFQFASSIKGGPNQPFTLTYNSLGHLTLFLVDYEDIKNETFLKVPTAPKCVKPQVSNVSNITQIGAQIQTQVSVLTPNVNSNVPTSTIQAALNTQTSLSSTTMAGNSNISAQDAKPENPNMNFVKTSIQQQEPNIVSVSKVDSNSNITTEIIDADSKQQLIKNLYIEEILLNIKDFDKQLKSSISSLKDLFVQKKEIGTTKEHEKINFESEFVIQMLEKLSSSYSSLNHDVNDLQTSCLELQYLLEETRTLLDRNIDPKYRYILQQRNLDPLTSRRMKEINTLRDYIEIQLRELNTKFDLEWKEWLQKKKRSSLLSTHMINSKVRSPPTLPHTSFITSATNSKSNKDSSLLVDEDILEKNVTSIVYKTLINNQQLIDNLKQQIKTIAKEVSLINKYHSNRNSNGMSGTKSNDGIQDLIKMLGDVSLVSTIYIQPAEDLMNKKTIAIQCLQPERKSSLKTFLENRHSVPIRVCRPNLNDGEFTNQQSRFTSVLEKIKEKSSKKTVQKYLNDYNIKTETSQNVPVLSSAVITEDIETITPTIPLPTTTSSFVSKQAQQNVTMTKSNTIPLTQPLVETKTDLTTVAKIPTFSLRMPLKSSPNTTVGTKVTPSVPKLQIKQKSNQQQANTITDDFVVPSTDMAQTVFSSGEFSTKLTSSFPKESFSTSKIIDQKTSTGTVATVNIIGNKSNESINSNFPMTLFRFGDTSQSRTSSSLLFNVKTNHSAVLPPSSSGTNISTATTKTNITIAPSATLSNNHVTISTNISSSFTASVTTTTTTITTVFSFFSSKLPSFSTSMFDGSSSSSNSFKFPLLPLPNSNNTIDKEAVTTLASSNSPSNSTFLTSITLAPQASTSTIKTNQTSLTFTGTLSNFDNNDKSQENNSAINLTENNVTTNDNETKASQTTTATTTTTATSKSAAILPIPSTTTSSNVSSLVSTSTSLFPSTPVSTVASSSTTTSLSSALKPSFPSFSSSLFETPRSGTNETNSNIDFKIVQSSTTVIQTAASNSSVSFSFNNALSSLSLVSSSGTSNPTATISQQQTNIFGSFSKTSSSSLLSNPIVSSSASIFDNTQNQTSPFKIGSTEQPKPLATNTGFESFSFGGNTSNNLQVSSNSSTSNLFGQQQNQTTGLFLQTNKNNTSIFPQQCLSTTNQQPKPFQPFSNTISNSTSSFGTSTTGGLLFGGSPVFSGAFGSTFGGMNAFGSINQQPIKSFTNVNISHSFGSMAFNNEPMPSFDSLANDDKNNSSTSFGSGSSGGHFFSTISQNSDAFTQRRG